MAVDKKSHEPKIISKSLRKIMKGVSLVLFGSVFASIFTFIGRLLVIRHYTQSDFGVFSLVFSILTIGVVISTLGIERSVIQRIAYSKGKKEFKKIPKFIASSIWLSGGASILSGAIIFLLSETISKNIFHESALVVPLRIFSVVIPFLTLINILVSIFRGFDQMKPTVFFQHLLINTLFPLFLMYIVFFNYPFVNVFYAYLASILITFIVLVIYIIKHIPFKKILSALSTPRPATKELLLFSLPLLGASILQLAINWTDILMIGGIKTITDVGLYSAARSLAFYISFPLGALLLIYMPVISGLYGGGKIDEMKRTFSILTKWLCYFTFPFFLILFLYSETITRSLFGSSYLFASATLRVLSIGFIISNFLGPNGATLIAIGKSRFIMFATLASAILNIGMNAALIPPFGIEGAAIASVVAVVSINVIKCWLLHSINGAHPLSWNLIKPTLVSLIIISLIYIILQNFLTVYLWMIPFLLVFYYLIYILAVLLTKSIDEEDLMMLAAIGKKLGIKSPFIGKLLGRSR